jgi:bifunctional DNA-binding transcriptional regulator/antitoxin component of YhaV-PrlF toxin-antitoxin module
MVEEPVIGRRLHATQGRPFPALVGGEHRTVDEKGRIVLPAGIWREAFGGQAYLAPWRHGSVALWPVAQFSAYLDVTAAGERVDGTVVPGAITLARRHAHSVVVDGHGRLTLPPRIRAVRGIGPGDHVFIEGQGDRLELRRTAGEDDADLDESLAAYESAIEMLDHY